MKLLYAVYYKNLNFFISLFSPSSQAPRICYFFFFCSAQIRRFVCTGAHYIWMVMAECVLFVCITRICSLKRKCLLMMLAFVHNTFFTHRTNSHNENQ